MMKTVNAQTLDRLLMLSFKGTSVLSSVRELRAVGISVDYAPVADLATNPDNPARGVRAFGAEPRHLAAIIEGLSVSFEDLPLGSGVDNP